MRALLLYLASIAPAFAATEDLAWLAGAWCGTNHGSYQEEVWLAPRAGSLVGMHRDTRDGAMRGFEFFRIVDEGSELAYWTQPEGRPAVAFRARETGKDAVDFVNAEHAFPKRVSYRRIDERTLVARIDDGTDNGRRREWRWTRDCR